MNQRVNIKVAQPQAYQAMYALEGYLNATNLSKTHRELIKVRASQINGCAFCIDLHTKDALKLGETNQRIFLLNAWHEVDLFTQEEKALLALTEEITLITKEGVTDETYKNLEAFFSQEVIAQLIMAVIAINAWNRMAIATRMRP